VNLSRAAAVMVTLAASGVFTQEPRPLFRSKVETVRVDVLVTEGGRPVRNLAAGDFEILDNGVRQRVDLVSFEQMPVNVILTLDGSDSVAGERLANLQAAGRAVLDALAPGDQAALIVFNHAVTVAAPLTPDSKRVLTAIDHVQPAGNTSLVDGSFAALVQSDTDVARALVIVFSDGLDTSSWLKPEAVIDVARRSGAVVYVVATGLARKGPFLRDLSEQTGGRLIEVEPNAKLAPIFLEALQEFRQRYLVGYSPAGVSREGWHDLTVRVKRRSATVRARPGYLVGR
jgi:VWFA-related protein